jgi:hypothetical protein
MSTQGIKVLIMAGGDESRWRGHLRTHKHLVNVPSSIGGNQLTKTEKLLQQTYRQVHCQPQVTSCSVFVRDREEYIRCLIDQMSLSTDKELSFIQVEPTQVVVNSGRKRCRHWLEESQPYWSVDGDTVILLGDVYYSESAISAIFSPLSSSESYKFYGREDVNPWTQCEHGEIFALRISSVDAIVAALNRAQQAFATGEECRLSCWEVYRATQSIPFSTTYAAGWVKSNWFELCDLTEDFDCPEDYDRFLQAHSRLQQINPEELLRWKFYSQQDSPGNDLVCLSGSQHPLDLLRAVLERYPALPTAGWYGDAMAFNTLGWVKHTVDLPLRDVSLFEHDLEGIFIRKHLVSQK